MVGDTMTAQLVTDALVMAIWRRGKPDALSHHSDQGSQYTSGQLQGLMAGAGQGGDTVALLMIDLDHFKLVNDGFGHDAGDEVLREFGVRLATNVRAIDLPCR